MRYFLLFIGLAVVQGSAIPGTESEKELLKGTVSGDKTATKLATRETQTSVLVEKILLELPAIVIKRPSKLKLKDESEPRLEIVAQGPEGQTILEVDPSGHSQLVNQGLSGQTIETGYRTVLVTEKVPVVPVVNKSALTKSHPELRWGVGQGAGGQGISTPYGYVNQGPGGQTISGPGYGYGNRLVSQGAAGQNIYGPSYRTHLLVKEKPLEVVKGTENADHELRYDLVNQGPGGQTIASGGPWGYPSYVSQGQGGQVIGGGRGYGGYGGGLVSQGPGGQTISPGYGYGGLVNQGASGQSIYRPSYRSVLVEETPVAVNANPEIRTAYYPPYGGAVNQGAGGQNVYSPYGGYVGQSGQGQTIGSPLYRLLIKEKKPVTTEKKERQYISTYGPGGGASLNQGAGGQYISAGRPYGGGAYVGQNSGGQSILYRTILKDKVSPLEVHSLDPLKKGETKTARYYVNQGQYGQTVGGYGGYGGYPSYVSQGGQGQSILGYRQGEFEEEGEEEEESMLGGELSGQEGGYRYNAGMGYETVPVAVVI